MAKKTPAPKSGSQSKSKKTTPKKAAAVKVTRKTTGKASAKKVVKKKTASTSHKAARKAPVRKAVTRKGAKKMVPDDAITKLKLEKGAPSKKAASKSAKKSVKKPEQTADTLVSKSKPVKKRSPASVTRSRANGPGTQTVTGTKTAPGTIRRPSAMKGRAKAARHSAFTLDDVREIARENKKHASKAQKKAGAIQAISPKPAPIPDDVKQEHRILGAASLADILGYVPGSKTPQEDEEKKVPKKYIRYYRLLVELRDHVNSELSLHTEDTLKHSSKEDSGDLSGYSQHVADTGTDTFDRDFALSLVSNEQEALHEVEEAINRIKTGTYGICELTGKPISKERLLAVPFARYSVESQAQVEKTTRRNVQRGGIFADATAEDSARFAQSDSDD